jgi:hypothetical protein
VRQTRVRTVGIAALLCVLGWPVSALAQGLTATAQSLPLPEELQPGIRTALGAATGAKVVMGGTTLELWWGAPKAASWDAVEEGAVIGALRVTGAYRDIRGKVVKPGVYTLRYGLQPQNGDHLGAAPNREFLLVSPAALDSDPKPLGFDGTVALAKETTGTAHPASLSIDPPSATEAPLNSYTTDPDLKGVVFKAGGLTFGLILTGRIEH